MNIFEQYGIKEVADVVFYSIELDENDDEVYVPVIYFDTLKVSTLEQTAQQAIAKGGLGNADLIVWDYGKEITLKLEDALFSPASQGMLWGGRHGVKTLALIGTFSKNVYATDVYGNTVYINNNGTAATPSGTKDYTCKFKIENFSDFSLTASTVEGEDKIFEWTCNVRISLYENLDKYYIEDLKIRCTTKKDGTRKWTIVSTNNKITKKAKNNSGVLVNIDIGTFTLDDNLNVGPPEETVYRIDNAIQNVKYLERMEKCKAEQTFVINTDSNTTHSNCRYLSKYAESELTVFIDPKTMQPYEPNTTQYTRRNGQVIEGNLRVIKQHEIYYKWTRTKAVEYTSLGHQIVVDATHFPGTYRVVGETYARSRDTGKDERYQFEIPLCKLSSNTSLTLQAEGEPTTFNAELRVLRREDGIMMKLTQYAVDKSDASGSTSIIPREEVVPRDPEEGFE